MLVWQESTQISPQGWSLYQSREMWVSLWVGRISRIYFFSFWPFFFLSIIIQSIVADHSNYFRNYIQWTQTYMKIETRKWDKKEEERTNWRRKRKERERKEYEETIKLDIRSTYTRRIQKVNESKSIRISLQKPNKMTKRISSQIPIAVESFAIIKNMSSWFNWI